MTKVSKKNGGNNANTVLCNVVEVDKIIKQLSKIQVKLMQVGITNEEYNEITDFIHNAKEYLTNMQSYKYAILQICNLTMLHNEYGDKRSLRLREMNLKFYSCLIKKT